MQEKIKALLKKYNFKNLPLDIEIDFETVTIDYKYCRTKRVRKDVAIIKELDFKESYHWLSFYQEDLLCRLEEYLQSIVDNPKYDTFKYKGYESYNIMTYKCIQQMSREDLIKLSNKIEKRVDYIDKQTTLTKKEDNEKLKIDIISSEFQTNVINAICGSILRADYEINVTKPNGLSANECKELIYNLFGHDGYKQMQELIIELDIYNDIVEVLFCEEIRDFIKNVRALIGKI